jgi:hypothetical protein
VSDVIDAFCSTPHYARQMRPIFDALPDGERGTWYDAHEDPEGGGVIIVGAYRDLRWVGPRYRRTCLVEHGIGQQYATQPDHPAYPGGRRDEYDLLLAPGGHVVDPAARETVCIGSPSQRGGPFRGSPTRITPTRFAVSFHWDCGIAREAGTAFWEYLPHLSDQAAALPGGLLVHAHPRIQFDVFEQVIGKPNLEPCEQFEQILDEACVYAADNTSTLYEFAAHDRPVVVLNSQLWRRDVQHGKRFWAWADVGEQIQGGGQLAGAMLRARDVDPQKERRRAIVDMVYGGNTEAGVEALVRLAS